MQVNAGLRGSENHWLEAINRELSLRVQSAATTNACVAITPLPISIHEFG